MNKKYSINDKLVRSYTAIDIESTGNSNFNYIIEIAAIKVVDGEIVSEFNSLVKPPKSKILKKEDKRVLSYFMLNEKKHYYINKFIENLTGIDNHMLSNALEEKTAIKILFDFLGDDIILGHGLNNDLNIINSAFRRILSKELTNKYIDTFNIALFLDNTDYSLVNLCNRFELGNEQIHRARADAFRTHLCYEKMLEELKSTHGACELDSIYLEWVEGRNNKKIKILRAKHMNSLNKKNWSLYKKEYLENQLIDIDFFESTFSISREVDDVRSDNLKNKLHILGTTANSTIGKYTDYAILEESELALGLDSQAVKKVVHFNKNGKRIRVLSYEQIEKIIENNEIECNDIGSNEIEIYDQDELKFDVDLDEKIIYIYNDFENYTKKEVAKYLQDKNAIVSNVIDEKIDYIIVGEGEDKKRFYDSDEIYELIFLLSIGRDIKVISEEEFFEIFGNILENARL